MTIILNFKTYPQSTGEDAIKCAKAAYEFSMQNKHKVIICPQFIDVEEIIRQFSPTDKFEVWTQHLDFMRGEKLTGFTTVDSLKKIGVKGSIINHAEHKITDIGNYVWSDVEMSLCLCVSDVFELALDLNRNPDFDPKYIAYEPPGLIGGKISVSEARPEEIENIVDKFVGYNILVGAGIKSNRDVLTAQALGAKGILISSAFVLADDRAVFLEDLTRDAK